MIAYDTFFKHVYNLRWLPLVGLLDLLCVSSFGLCLCIFFILHKRKKQKRKTLFNDLVDTKHLLFSTPSRVDRRARAY